MKGKFSYRTSLFQIPYKNLVFLVLYFTTILIMTIFIFKKAYQKIYDPISGLRIGDSVDYIEISSRQRESRELFRLIDQNENGNLGTDEMESYVMYRFKNYDKFIKDAPLLDPNGKPTFKPHELVLSNEFIAGLDANKNGKIEDVDLTIENVEALFEKAKLIIKTLDLDSNGSVDWDEFYNCI